MANWVADFLEKHPEQAGWPVAKRAKHSLHLKRPDGIVEANFTGAPCHYLDGGLWKPIDTKLQLIGTEYGAPGLRGRISKNGIVKIFNSGYSHRSTRIGIFDPTTKAFTAVKTIPLGAVSDNQIIAESGIWKRVLTLTESGVREEIIIQSKPTGTGADLNDWLVLETQVPGMSFPDGELDSFELEEFRFPPPSTSDANGDVAPCKRFARTIGGNQFIYTGVPVSWLATAIYPVTIDPDFADSTDDATIYGTHATVYSTARSTSYAADLFGTSITVGNSYVGGAYYVWRGYLKFDTSAIPDTDTVTRVDIKLVAIADNSTTDFWTIVIPYDWSAQDPISAGTREAAYDGCLAASSSQWAWRSSAGISLNTQYSAELTTAGPAWINKTGSTYFGLMNNYDYSNTTPTADGRLAFASQENATAAYRPVLTVLYAPAPKGNFFAFF